MFNAKYIKDNAQPGSWRRGYDYHKKNMVLEMKLSRNVITGKVKGNFQDFIQRNSPLIKILMLKQNVIVLWKKNGANMLFVSAYKPSKMALLSNITIKRTK